MAWRAYLGSCGPAELVRGLALLLQVAGKLLGNIRQLQPVAHVVDTEGAASVLTVRLDNTLLRNGFMFLENVPQW